MIAVIFEVEPHPERAGEYFDLAAGLRDELMAVDGFLSVERFESLINKGKYLSLSFWRDRQAVDTWYASVNHGAAQTEGRSGIFKDYRIRVAEVFRDYDMAAGRPKVSAS